MDNVLALEKTGVSCARVSPRDAMGVTKGKGHDLPTLPVSSPVHKTVAEENSRLLHSDGVEP